MACLDSLGRGGDGTPAWPRELLDTPEMGLEPPVTRGTRS